MATTQEYHEQPSFRRDSPSPSRSPTPAIGACPELSRCVSTASNGSNISGTRAGGRESLGSSVGSSVSRSSSASYTSRQSFGGLAKPERRGYVRPQGTNFAKSAQSRESVLSLGSIAHLQYYFARTGLLDGKGGRLAKKRNKADRGTLDLSALDVSFLTPQVVGSDVDSSYASMGSSPELFAAEGLVESPINEEGDEYFSGEDEEHPHMLPPTVSTYNHREKPVPHPPTLEELKEDLKKSLEEADKVLANAKAESFAEAEPESAASPTRPGSSRGSKGWYELQGMNILDVITLAIRAAKMYYTAHDQPARLSAIKSERDIRSELLSVMDVLKRMATRDFAGGMKTEEREIMEEWIVGCFQMLKQEEEMELTEKEQRTRWTWLNDSWAGKPVEREYAFLKSMDPEPDTLPPFEASETASELPTPLLADLKTGVRLVKLHNAIVRKSKRPFGAIPTFHTDTRKPYRCAENLRYWIKAAELRWDIVLKVDVMGVVNDTDDEALRGLEAAIWKWSEKVRGELTTDLNLKA
ncbi:hypothetical protein BP6252_14176 [Coleophoma cylindrospora]|uniref:Calponin-homology (CH) domain-containing protein n=1 Tax=Coleophoma cylindrospora TaxID=1849047 RepID=A0A3D8Q3P2_9HELO|nr:hypothetical protein BP6252_14176 [Coleophoma cylindrospora]